ncbi:hypothetical protein [Atopobacter phocae]|uniref:hypothetical protein n=1 Tax=Atopobacter phocae TaxID=136492 RepID=UPI000470E342|nr:hypothetical protein [Atopobacter phocae]
MLQYELTDMGRRFPMIKRVVMCLAGGILLSLTFVLTDWNNQVILDPALVKYPLIAMFIAGVAYWYLFLTINRMKEEQGLFSKLATGLFAILGFSQSLRFTETSLAAALVYLIMVVYFYWRYFKKTRSRKI